MYVKSHKIYMELTYILVFCSIFVESFRCFVDFNGFNETCPVVDFATALIKAMNIVVHTELLLHSHGEFYPYHFGNSTEKDFDLLECVGMIYSSTDYVNNTIQLRSSLTPFYIEKIRFVRDICYFFYFFYKHRTLVLTSIQSVFQNFRLKVLFIAP